MKKCIVSFADTPVYQNKMRRLEKSIPHGVDFLGFTDVRQIECESHREIPYKFKPAAIDKARLLGYDLVIWADSPIHVIKPLDQFFEYLEEQDYAFFDNIGHSLGMWTNDKALEYFGMDREKALQTKMIMACCMGFNFGKMYVNELVDEYYELADMLYPGEWTAPEVYSEILKKNYQHGAHRHDQTLMSFLINRDGFNILTGHETFFIYEDFRKIFKISPTVCLVSQ